MAKKRDTAPEIGDADIVELRRLEEAIRKGDGDVLRARWESGRYLVTRRQGGKQLPRGLGRRPAIMRGLPRPLVVELSIVPPVGGRHSARQTRITVAAPLRVHAIRRTAE